MSDELISILSNSTLKKIINDYWVNDKKKQEVAYNVFNLSSYNNQLENFHSDIIASFLDPNGLHNEGNIFLMEFISYLNLDKSKFQNSKVLREHGRLDILILDKESDNAIIIENKINDAPDMDTEIDTQIVDTQISRYYNFCKNRNKKVIAIIYLTKDGIKKAPYSLDNIIDNLVLNIAAFSNTPDDLVNGWLTKCLVTATKKDSLTMLYQYIKLIKHLSAKQFDMENNKSFYEFVSETNLFSYAKELEYRLMEIPNIRRDIIAKQISNYKPFQKMNCSYKPNMILFENYFDNGYKLKLDVCFEYNGDAYVQLWIPDLNSEDSLSLMNQIITKKLQNIGMIGEMETIEENYFRNTYSLNELKTLKAVDEKVLSFTTKLFKALNNSQK